MGDGRRRSVEGRCKVDWDDEVKLIGRKILKRGEMMDERIIEKNIGVEEKIEGFGNEIEEILGFRNIRGNIDEIRKMLLGKNKGKRMVLVKVGEGVY